MIFILYNLCQIDDGKSYYEKALQINSNLTLFLTEKELPVFKEVMNSNTTKQCSI